jgi:hypothetical protein
MMLVLLLHLAASTPLECWDSVCPSDYIGDNFCDTGCMIQICSFESKTPSDKTTSDCYSDCISSSCQSSLLKDGVCNNGKVKPACNSATCGFDFGDCGYCASGCFESNLGDGICDDACNVKACRYDNNDCVSAR